MKWLRFRKSKEHEYMSTACMHELHERCRQNCKFCYAACGCACHKEKTNG